MDQFSGICVVETNHAVVTGRRDRCHFWVERDRIDTALLALHFGVNGNVLDAVIGKLLFLVSAAAVDRSPSAGVGRAVADI